MANKISTLILKVDLQCIICSKKIRKVLGKLQDRENIQSVVYDEKESIVIVSGTFDPKKLSKKLCCKACKVINDIQIKQKKPEKPPPPPLLEPEPEPAPALTPAPALPESTPAPPVPDPPAPELAPLAPSEPKAAPAPPPNPELEPAPAPPSKPEPEPEPAPAPQPAPMHEKPAPVPLKPDPSYLCPYPYPYPYPYPMAWPFIPTCGCHGWCNCKSIVELPSSPSMVPTCSAPCYDGCRACMFICEDEPSFCSIM